MKVSVIVPVYNTEKYLKNCIDSLLKQNFEDYEIIVINDLSPGNAEEIIKSYNDKKIVYIKNKTNKGIGYNRNLGIKKAKGENNVQKSFLRHLFFIAGIHNRRCRINVVFCRYGFAI